MTTRFTTSKDGTKIAYETDGQGKLVVLVDGAFGSRAFGPTEKVAGLLRSTYKVVRYDRRGRNESTDTSPYSVEREVDDLIAVIAANGEAAQRDSHHQ